MSKLNKKGQNLAIKKTNTISYNGNPQYKHDDLFQLYNLIVSHFFGKDTYYETNDKRLFDLNQVINRCVAGNKFDVIANLISNARHDMYMRTMPIVATILFAKALRDQNKSFSALRQLMTDVINRPDQITDAFAFAKDVFGDKKKIPYAIKRGIGDAFNKFSEYSLAKYNSSNEVKLRDVLRVAHPTPISEYKGELFSKVMNGTLEEPNTWERKLSKNGQLPKNERKSKKVIWEEMVDSGDLGMMALIRNLRNMWDAGISNVHKTKICKIISDPKEVVKSKQMPFRFVNAMENTNQFGDGKLLTAFSSAIDISLGNLPKLGEKVWIIVDCSGSMSGTPIKTATLFAAALLKANKNSEDVKLTMFATTAQHVSINLNDSVMTISEKLMRSNLGGGTDLGSALKLKKTLGFEPDCVVVLSDMQVNQLQGNATNIFAKNCVKVAFNLNGHDNTPLAEFAGWYQLTGWSDRVFDFVPAMRDKESIVKALDKPYVPKTTKYNPKYKLINNLNEDNEHE